MSAESQIIVEKLKGRIEQIISKYELSLSENVSLKEELEKNRRELEESRKRVKELEGKMELMQLGEAFKASSEDVKEAKKKITRIVREIDKCISMLND